MFVLKAITYFLSLANTFGNRNNFHLSELIEKIHLENDIDNVCFIGADFDFVGDFVRNHSNIKVLIITSLADVFTEIPHMTLLVVDVSHYQEQELMPSELEEFIRKLQVRKFVIVSADNFQKLHDYFLFFEENKFTRIFGITNNTPFVFMPYADSKIQQVQMDVKLPNALKDLNGFVFRTTVERNIPRTFWYKKKDGKRKIGGCFGQIFLGFLQRHNAIYKEIKLHNASDMYSPALINATIENRIDISMNAYGGSKDLDSTYPVKFGKFQVMVPLNGYVSPNEYFERPFSPTVWALVGLTLVYVVLIDVVLKILTNEPVEVWRSFSHMFLAMIGLPRERPVTTAYRLHFQVFVLAFILVNIYVISFTSFLTVYIKVKQFNTLKDLMDNNVKVMMMTFIWAAIFNSGSFPPGFENIVVAVDQKTYLTELYSMKNTSFGYAVSADTSDFLLHLQACFRKPLFHMTHNSLLEYTLGFTLVKYSPFKEILSDFIFDVMETGLVNKWELDVVVQAPYAGVEELLVQREDIQIVGDEHAALTVQHLMFCWNLLALGWTIAACVFVGEKLSKLFLKF
ncbi:uncharacterized protein LOC129944852 [Eupeodes corollae]|uniref:uncharacterized protein LOC129944852 n=1 Tax=Eupeodes corollae TaxID=290404 RepID=UPI00249002E1|nr:uncharacterized protein LOC129944852 [Eupeodes corollae]